VDPPESPGAPSLGVDDDGGAVYEQPTTSPSTRRHIVQR
jgi:hypothetical protein